MVGEYKIFDKYVWGVVNYLYFYLFNKLVFMSIDNPIQGDLTGNSVEDKGKLEYQLEEIELEQMKKRRDQETFDIENRHKTELRLMHERHLKELKDLKAAIESNRSHRELPPLTSDSKIMVTIEGLENKLGLKNS